MVQMTGTRKKRAAKEAGSDQKQRTCKGEILAALLIVLLVVGVAFWVNRFFYGFDLPEIADHGPSAAETGGVAQKEAFRQPDDWRLILVNRDHPIEEAFSGELTERRHGAKVDSRIYPDLQEMFDEMRADGLSPRVVEGYRTAEEQQERLDSRIREYMGYGKSREEAREMALQWEQEPGTSEHELGICVDISSEDADNESANEVWSWMDVNCSRFGFIKRYPRDKTAVTGVRGAQWHYRYVGEEAAREITEKGITLEEYLTQLQKRK